MPNILVIEENEALLEMYRTTLESTGFNVIHFPNYQELYKHLNGDGFTAILASGQTIDDNMAFISKIRNGSTALIPIFVVTAEDVNHNQYLKFADVTCFPGFPDSGSILKELSGKLPLNHQFKGLLHSEKAN